MKRILFAAGLWLLCGTGASLFAFRGAANRPIPNYDKRQAEHPASVVLPADKQPAADRLQELLPAVRVDVDRILHTPNFIAAPHEFLSGPNGSGKAVSAQSAAAFRQDDPHQPVKAFLREHAALFGHGAEVLNSARVNRDYTTPHNALRTTVWQQQLDDIDVFEAVLMGHATAKGELVSISSYFLADPANAADNGLPGRKAKQQNPTVSAKQALALSAKAIGEDVTPEIFTALDDLPEGAHQRQRFKGDPQFNESRVQLVWLPISASELRLCWLVRIISREQGQGYHVLIDADSGELMVRRLLSVNISNATYNVYTSDSPSPFSPGSTSPSPFQPPLLPRTTVVTPALNTNASPLGWINDGVNETRGNNADAHLDRDKNDQPDLPRPQGNPNRVFDFPLDLTQQPTTYGNAAVVQLFYWCNWMHDKLYEVGFTEAAGNYQNNNFGRGGQGNDAMQADSQDGSGFNNANLTPDFDGFPARIQMYVFNGPSPQRDGDLDSEVVLHEYTHGLSERLVGGGVLITELQTAGMGEGWSDFYALTLLSEPGDDVDAPYPMGGYITYLIGGSGINQNYYFGIRRYPYSTDLTKNPLTFKDIDPGQADGHSASPLSPLSSPFSSADADEVHNQGEVWCITLWEARANLIRKWGYAVGNNLILKLVTDGMKLSPANPNFLQARDAIIQADLVSSGGANYNELWAAFAKRGMGGSASSPSSSSTLGVVEAFDVPGLALRTVTPKDNLTGNNNGVIDPNECIELFVSLKNSGRRIANNITSTLSNITPGIVISQGDSSYPSIPVGGIATNLTTFRIFVPPTFPCGGIIDLSLTVRSDQDTRVLKIRLNTGSVGSAVRFDSTAAVAIPDADARGVDSPITVSGFQGTLGRVTVSLFLNHTWDGDLILQLVAPDGTKVLLSSHNGFSSDNYGTGCASDSNRTTFDDNAATPISGGRAPFLGSYRPQQPLAAMNGKSGFAVNGTWSLHVVDDFFFDVGTLQCWSLNLSPNVCTIGPGECSTDLAITSAISPNPPAIGSNITYTLFATNRGGIAASGVYVTNILPPGLQFLSSTTTRGTCSQTNGIVLCSIGSLAPGAGASITIRAQPAIVGYVTNVAIITGLTADGNLSNNVSTLVSLIPAPVPVMVAGGAHLISESVAPPNGGIDPNESVTIGFFLRNVGTRAASNLVATLLSGDGVNPSSGPQVYGYVPLNAAPVSRSFTFTATGTNGQVISPTLQLQDGTNDLGNVSFQFGLHAAFSFVNANVITIPAVGAAQTYPSSVFVSGLPGVVSRVTVTLSNLTHTFPEDLDILLVSPNGRSVVLMSDAGGANGLNNVTVAFDDFAENFLPDSTRISSGTFRPSNYDGGDGDLFPSTAPAGPYASTLSEFNGGNPNGKWSLFIYDDTPGDNGRLGGGWRLDIETSDPVDATANIAVTGTAAPDPVMAGSNVVYTVFVSNFGPDLANDVVVSSQLPVGSSFVSAQNNFGTCFNAGTTVTCNLGSVSKDDQVSFTIETRVTRSGTATNLLSVQATEVDPSLANNSYAVQSSVSPAADVAISIVPSLSPAVANQNLIASVIVTNLGPNSASGIVVSNRLPAGVPIVSVNPSQGTLSTNGDMLIWSCGTVASSAKATLAVTLRPVSAGTITNVADVKSSSPTDLSVSNNTATLIVPVSDGPVIIVPAGTVLISESFPTGGIDPGETVSVSFALRNIGISNAASVTAILRNTGGVSSPSGPQNYGALLANGSATARTFSFTATSQINSTISATFDLLDGASNLGSVTFPFVLGAGHHFANSSSIAIRDNNFANPYPSIISVTGLTGTVANVSVTLSNLSHGFPDDLDVLVVAPNGRSVLLMSDAAGPTPISGVNLTFDQTASAPLSDSAPAETGVYLPSDYQPADSFPAPAPSGPYVADLSLLNGIDPNGVWSLFIVDDYLSDNGQLGGWSLDITTIGRLNLPPRIRAVSIVGGHCQFTIDGQAGDRLVIESSTNLTNWSPISSSTLNASSMLFSDPSSATGNQVFYRIQRQP